jgi:lipoprotein NlpD
MEKIRPSLTLVICIMLALFFVNACFKFQTQNGTEKGVYHLVKKNETVEMVAAAYGYSLPKLIRVNNITDVNSVREGTVLFIPSATRVKDIAVKKNETVKTLQKTETQKPKIAIIAEPIQDKKTADEKIAPQSKTPSLEKKMPVQNDKAVKKETNEIKASAKTSAAVPEKKMQAGKNNFVWPVKGEVTANFGAQPNKTFNNWIKISSSTDTKVKAAESGMVIFSSSLKNYGETIIIRHTENFATVYTHLKKRYVKIDKNVKKGEPIALLGEKDETGKAYMNFEVRQQGKARNPIQYLP